MIKSLKNGKAPVLQQLVSVIFNSGVYLDKNKEALTVVIYKKGDPEELKSYRPISLLSVFNKIVEKIIAKETTDHLERNRVLSEGQYGFRRHRGTEDAVLNLQKYVIESLESQRIPLIVMLNFSSAFDCVNHGRLLEKLRCAGITDTALKVFASYLENRTQELRCGYIATSDPTGVRCGVPQGGSLSALLFSLYINDLLTMSDPDASLMGYADDICLKFRFEGPIDLNVVETSVHRVFEWSKKNGLLLNSKKSNYMIFGQPNPRIKVPLYISCGDDAEPPNEIENVLSTKYLGIEIDEKLLWDQHVNILRDKLRAATATLAKVRVLTSARTATSVYKAIFESYLRYGILAYMSSAPSNLKPIITLQNAAVRRILRAGPRENPIPLY